VQALISHADEVEEIQRQFRDDIQLTMVTRNELVPIGSSELDKAIGGSSPTNIGWARESKSGDSCGGL
jgi:hypothetical protein